MKKTYQISAVLLLILAVSITYLGLQREQVFNPPVITGVGFLVIAVVFLMAAGKGE